MANIQADVSTNKTALMEMLMFMQYQMLPFHQLLCRYSYHCRLRRGMSDLVGRDQAVANALKKIYCTTNVKLLLAFVGIERSGQH